MKRFQTFEGVFTPALLSILGVIMYLRLGWVVGQVGLGAALVIIVLANLITIATALSMSSIVTNIRIGAGGAYSVIAKSLGLEAGGAVGMPLYLAQAVSVAFYITGFSECWIFVFPAHNPVLVSLVVWVCLFVISYYSTKMAFRMQFVIMVIIGLSLVSIFLGKGEPQNVSFGLDAARSGSFWLAFAIFFPAVTGVMAGAAMSGELKEPKKSIPLGTLAAVAISFCVYILLAVWLSANVSADTLVNNKLVLIDVGRWKWLVVGGIMGATLSSALSMFVGSPRTLLALGKHQIIPFSNSFARINKKGEPVAAILFTSLLVLVTLLLGTLDKVAGLLTMFFLITYAMINLSVFIEQTLGIASFRPTFRVSRVIPLFGGLGCVAVMVLINVKFSLVALVALVAIYFFLVRREMNIHAPNVKSGILIFLAEKFAQAAARLPYYPKIWKPNVLVPVENKNLLSRIIPFLRSLLSPSGRVLFLDVLGSSGAENESSVERKKRERDALSALVIPLQDDGLFVGTSVVECSDISEGRMISLQMAKDMFFPPNTLFYHLEEQGRPDDEVLGILRKASAEGLGVVVLKMHEEARFGEEQTVNLWIRKQSPNIDLAVLMALQLRNNWDGHMRILQVVGEQEDISEARVYLDRVKKIMRLPLDVKIEVLSGEFKSVLAQAPQADINIFGMPEEPDLNVIRDVSGAVRTSVLFLRDSEHESAVA